MAYYDVYLLRNDSDFLARSAACYTSETPLGTGEDPGQWSQQHAWDLAGSPTFGDKYASALAGGVPDPGRDESVISDPEILSAVQAIMAAEPPADPVP
jgi:hypothetical protein